MNTNKKGFTLIELLVVIVIIGILATISVATFGGYFKKARDAERQSTVQNVATIMKVLNAVEEKIDYSPAADTMSSLNARLSDQGYSASESKNGNCYYYGYIDGHAELPDNSEFFIAASSEETPGTIFAAGTPTGVTEAKVAAVVTAITAVQANSAACAAAGATAVNGAVKKYTVFGW